MAESSEQDQDLLTGESNDYRIRKTYSAKTMLRRNKSYKVGRTITVKFSLVFRVLLLFIKLTFPLHCYIIRSNEILKK